jgi:hypothetical protein
VFSLVPLFTLHCLNDFVSHGEAVRTEETKRVTKPNPKPKKKKTIGRVNLLILVCTV